MVMSWLANRFALALASAVDVPAEVAVALTITSRLTVRLPCKASITRLAQAVAELAFAPTSLAKAVTSTLPLIVTLSLANRFARALASAVDLPAELAVAFTVTS